MKARQFWIPAIVVALAAGFNEPAPGQFLIDISCEGTVCGGGGGTTAYRYTLMNVSGAPLVLTDFAPGTDDLNQANYTGWVAPPGFPPVATVVPPSPPLSVMYTSGTQTPHGLVPPPGGPATAGVIHWVGSLTLPPGGTATFGFNNPNTYQDTEWQVSTSAGYNVAWSDLPVAGPLGTFTHGYVHTPVASKFLIDISCEGTVCGGGGGTTAYRYTLKNVSGAPLVLKDFAPGTDDLNVANYTGWLAPPGFAPVAMVVPPSPPLSVMYTSGKQTKHGLVPPPGGPRTAGVIHWAGSLALSPGGTATFGFNNPNTFQDTEWQVSTSAGYNVAWSDLPVAGPLGTFTHGYVHTPVASKFLIDISCEGTVCGGGGGTTAYRYTLMNVSGAPLVLTDFAPGTDDLNMANYTGWVAPPGFAPVPVVGPPVPPLSITCTTRKQTPHGVVPPLGLQNTAGVIHWVGSLPLPPNGTATFGFNNPNTFQDTEWQVGTSMGANVGLWNLPIAGPLGTFTHGYVHTPAPCTFKFVPGVVPDWEQPWFYTPGSPNGGPGPGSGLPWDAWCAPTSAANLCGHWEDTHRRPVGDGMPWPTALFWPSFDWQDFEADASRPPPMAPPPFPTDLGWYMDTNNSGWALGNPAHPGTYLKDIHFGLRYHVNFFDPGWVWTTGTQGWAFAAGFAPSGAPAALHPNPASALAEIVGEINAGRTLIISWYHWDINKSGLPPVGDVEFYDFNPNPRQDPWGNHEEWNFDPFGEGLGHAVTAVGYLLAGNPKNPRPGTDWIIVHDNVWQTAVNVAVPFDSNVWVANTNANAVAKPWFTDGFEAYPLGPLAPQGGWATWYAGGDNGTVVGPPSPVHAGQRALRYDLPGMTQAGTDVTQTFNYRGGKWGFIGWTYVPSNAGGIGNKVGYLILLNQYTPVSGSDSWSMEVQFNLGTGLVTARRTPTVSVPLVKDQWVELHADIDLVTDRLDIYYNGAPLSLNRVWTTNVSTTGTLSIQCMDLYSSTIDGMFVDDVALLPAGAGDGDLNCDGKINFDDIDPFVLALSNPAAYQQQFPNCYIYNGDVNDDGRVDFDDIDPFVALLGA